MPTKLRHMLQRKPTNMSAMCIRILPKHRHRKLPTMLCLLPNLQLNISNPMLVMLHQCLLNQRYLCSMLFKLYDLFRSKRSIQLHELLRGFLLEWNHMYCRMPTELSNVFEPDCLYAMFKWIHSVFAGYRNDMCAVYIDLQDLC